MNIFRQTSGNFVNINKYIIATQDSCEEIITVLGPCVALIGKNLTKGVCFMTHLMNSKLGQEMIADLRKELKSNFDLAIEDFELTISGGFSKSHNTLRSENTPGEKNIIETTKYINKAPEIKALGKGSIKIGIKTKTGNVYFKKLEGGN